MEEIKLWGIPILYIFVAIAVLLPRVPVIGKFFNIINTAIHESGHALMALLLQGKVHKIELMSDTSGTTTTQCKTAFGRVLISLMGYPFASALGLLCCYLCKVGYQEGTVVGLTILFLIMLVFWIRNAYGLVWVLLFTLLNGWLVYDNNELYINLAALLYAVVIVIESVSSTVILLILTVRDSSAAGDATNLAKTTHIPAFIWAMIFLAFSAWMACHSALLLL